MTEQELITLFNEDIIEHHAPPQLEPNECIFLHGGLAINNIQLRNTALYLNGCRLHYDESRRMLILTVTGENGQDEELVVRTERLIGPQL